MPESGFTFIAKLAPDINASNTIKRHAAFLDWLNDYRPVLGADDEGNLWVSFEINAALGDDARSLLRTAVGKLILAAQYSGDFLPSILQISAVPTTMYGDSAASRMSEHEIDLTDEYLQIQLEANP